MFHNLLDELSDVLYDDHAKATIFLYVPKADVFIHQKMIPYVHVVVVFTPVRQQNISKLYHQISLHFLKT